MRLTKEERLAIRQVLANIYADPRPWVASTDGSVCRLIDNNGTWIAEMVGHALNESVSANTAFIESAVNHIMPALDRIDELERALRELYRDFGDDYSDEYHARLRDLGLLDGEG